MNDALTESTLGEIFEISSSKRVLRKQWRKEGIPFYRAREIVKLARDGKVDNELFISEDLFSELTVRFGSPQPGDLMVSAVGTLGACYVVQPGDRFYFKDASVIRLSPKQPVCPGYFRHAFRTKLILDQINSGSGSTVGTFTISRAKNTRVPLPSLKEQKRIAAILDAADALRAKRRETLAQLDTLLQSTFLEMFGDPVTNPKGWTQVELQTLIEAGDKINYGVVQPGEEFPDGRPLVRVGDFVQGELNLKNVKKIDPRIEEKYKRSRLTGSEILVSCVGSIGTVCAVPKEAEGFNIARAVARVPIRKEVEREFVIHCLKSEAVQRHFLKETRTVSQPTLNIAMIKTAPVIQPPVDLQYRFKKIAQSIEQQKSRLRAHLDELDTLFASLQARAFAGEL